MAQGNEVGGEAHHHATYQQVQIPTRLTPHTVGKRHVRMLTLLDKQDGVTASTLRQNVAGRFNKLYEFGDFHAALDELRTMGYALQYEDMFYLSESGVELYNDIRQVHPQMFEVSTSPNVAVH